MRAFAWPWRALVLLVPLAVAACVADQPPRSDTVVVTPPRQTVILPPAYGGPPPGVIVAPEPGQIYHCSPTDSTCGPTD